VGKPVARPRALPRHGKNGHRGGVAAALPGSPSERGPLARKVRAVGIDTPSIDYGQSTTFDTHQTLFAADIPAFENVAHLSALPATGAFVIALPMKIRGGSGGPLRVVAVIPEGVGPM
jgi:hypothetical protein